MKYRTVVNHSVIQFFDLRFATAAAGGKLDLAAIGPAIEHHELFPNRTNVSWYAELEPGVIRARIFERGVGETMSSGTGATGAAIAAAIRMRSDCARRQDNLRSTEDREDPP